MMRWLERRIILDVVDTQWKDHLLTLDHLKEGIGLRGYGQKDPLVEFKKEAAFNLFEDMMARIDKETTASTFSSSSRRSPKTKHAKSNGARGASRSSCNTRPARHRQRLLNPSEPARAKCSAAQTIPVPAAAERSTRSAAAKQLSDSAPLHGFCHLNVC